MQEVDIMSEDRLKQEENILEWEKKQLEKAREKFKREENILEQEKRLEQEKKLEQEEERLKQKENMLNQIKEKIKRRISMFELLSYEPFEKYKPFRICKNPEECKYFKDCKNTEECEYFEDCKNHEKCRYFEDCKNHEECEYFEDCKDLERDFVRSVLNGSCDCTGKTYYEELFYGFHNNRGSSSLNWLANWIKQYYNGQDYPILLKKICYYYMVKHKCNSEDIANALGITPKSASELLKQWNLDIDYRRASENCKEIELLIYRRGKKQPYLIEFIQKTYYESLRNRVNKPDKKDLPVFVDIFGGTGIVASSMNVKSAYKIVNDFDPVMIATFYALIFYSEVFIEKFRRFNLDIVNGYYEDLIHNIPTNEFIDGAPHGLFYKSKEEKEEKKNGIPLIYYNDTDLDYQFLEEKEKGASDDKLKLLKLIRNAWFYSQYALFGTSNSATQIRDLSKMHFYDKNNPHTPEVRDKICEIACYFIYYHHSGGGLPSGEPDFRQYNEREHYNLLKNYFKIPKMEPQSRSKSHLQQVSDDRVKYFLNLKDLKIKKDFLKDWRKGLKDAVIGQKSFEEIFPANVEQQVKKVGVEVSNIADRTFYYLDSPYFLKTQYAEGFTDEMHKVMLDNLRDSNFDWMFSMQYEELDKDTVISGKESDRIDVSKGAIRKIYNYAHYFYGFLAKFIVDPDDDGFYIADIDYNKINTYRDLYLILPDYEKLKENGKVETIKKCGMEIFVTSVDTRKVTPYGDEFVQLSMKKFLEYIRANFRASSIPNYGNYNPYNVTFFGNYDDVLKFAKTEYEKELTP